MTTQHTWSNRFVFGLLCVLVFTIPFDDVIEVPGFGTLTRLLGYATLLAAIGDILARGRFQSLRGPAGWAFLFGGWAGLSLLWTSSLEGTLDKLPTIVRCVGLFWLLYEYADRPARVNMVLQIFVLGAYVCVAGVLLSFEQDVSISNSDYTRFAMAALDPNDIAATVSLGIPMVWYLLGRRPSAILAWVNWLYIPLAIIVVFLTGSRGGFLTMTMALLIIVWSLRNVTLRLRVAAAVAFCLVVLGARELVPESAFSRLETIPQEVVSGTMAERVVLWRAGLDIVKDHPIAGLGLGAFKYAVFESGHFYKPVVAHNALLGVWFDLGFVGVFLFASLMVSAFILAGRLAAGEKLLCRFLVLTWFVAGCSMSVEYRKITWFMLGLVTASIWNGLRPRGDPSPGEPECPSEYES